MKIRSEQIIFFIKMVYININVFKILLTLVIEVISYIWLNIYHLMTMNISPLFLFLSLFFINSIQSQNYWQQEVDYKITVDINAKNNSYQGDKEIIYTNNSLDTLNKVFFHLYFNAFRKGSNMAVR